MAVCIKFACLASGKQQFELFSEAITALVWLLTPNFCLVSLRLASDFTATDVTVATLDIYNVLQASVYPGGSITLRGLSMTPHWENGWEARSGSPAQTDRVCAWRRRHGRERAPAAADAINATLSARAPVFVASSRARGHSNLITHATSYELRGFHGPAGALSLPFSQLFSG